MLFVLLFVYKLYQFVFQGLFQGQTKYLKLEFADLQNELKSEIITIWFLTAKAVLETAFYHTPPTRLRLQIQTTDPDPRIISIPQNQIQAPDPDPRYRPQIQAPDLDPKSRHQILTPDPDPRSRPLVQTPKPDLWPRTRSRPQI